MLTIFNYVDAESLVMRGEEDFRLRIVNPNIINKIQLYLTGRVTKGVQIIGVGPFAMRAYYSLAEYSRLVGKALENKYMVYIKKDGKVFQKGEWYLEFKL
ncbi:MAG: hypothetical protein K9J16_02010 [Melioribacteraceae bacterium]|nr:hypothetical protein [Melioribacteraceae bacterium]MCF8353041.1 hypothetical protein [Melioribacteraceae bacterium]MCF8392932.1 hypothetical protein [Melioribacteraceae bacterium]MCF8417773.1 hypothetical protein [Melioribacteraceae bacterium]